MASAHGAGFMVLPFVMPTPADAVGRQPRARVARGVAGANVATAGAMAVAVHTLAYLVVMTLAAWIVYRKLGLSLLRTGLAQHGLAVGRRAGRDRRGRAVEVVTTRVVNAEQEKVAMRQSHFRFIRQQGFDGGRRQRGLYSALMLQPRIIGGLVALGMLFQSPWLFLALSAVLLWSTLVPTRNPFDAIYNHLVARPRAFRRWARAGTAAFCAGYG